MQRELYEESVLIQDKMNTIQNIFTLHTHYIFQ